MNRLRSAGRGHALLFAGVSSAAVAAVLGFLVYREWSAFAGYDWRLDWRAILAAFFLLLGGLALAALAWAAIMHILGSRLPLRFHLRTYVVTHLARRLPGTVWYVAGRSYLYRQAGESVRLATIASSLEYVLLTVSGALVTLALWLYALRSLSPVYVPAAAILVLVGLLATRPASIRYYLAKAGLPDVPNLRGQHIAGLIVVYAGVWIVGGIMFFAIAHAVAGVALMHLGYIVACWCLVGTLSVVVFFLPSNFGFTEVGLSLLLSAIMPSSVAVLVAILSRVFIIVFELIAAGLVTGALMWTERKGRPT